MSPSAYISFTLEHVYVMFIHLCKKGSWDGGNSYKTVKIMNKLALQRGFYLPVLAELSWQRMSENGFTSCPANRTNKPFNLSAMQSASLQKVSNRSLGAPSVLLQSKSCHKKVIVLSVFIT